MKIEGLGSLDVGTCRKLIAFGSYIPVFEEAARRWKITIILDYPEAWDGRAIINPTPEFQKYMVAQGREAEPPEPVKYRPTVHEYIPGTARFHFRNNRYTARAASIDSIFGYCFPDGKAHQERTSMDYESDIFDARNCVVEIRGSYDANFTVDLAEKPTENILECLRLLINLSIAKILIFTDKSYSDKRNERLGKVLRRKLVKNGMRATEALERFLREHIAEHKMNASGELAKVQNEARAKLQRKLVLEEKIRFINDFIASIKSEKRREDYGEMFEEILRIQGITKVEVTDPPGDRPSIWFYTDKMRQYVRDTGIRYDVGAFQCGICPFYSTREGIYINQTLHGQHIHRNAMERQLSTGICFGNPGVDRDGLNSAIDKLMGLFELPTIVNLIMSFLQLDNTMPALNVSHNAATYETATPPKYASDKERAEQKEKFIRLVEATYSRIYTSGSKRELDKLENETALLNADYWELIRKKRELERFLKYIAREEAQITTTAQKQLGKLLKNKQVVFVEYENGLRIYLSDEKTRTITMLWFNIGRNVWIISPLTSQCRGASYSPYESVEFTPSDKHARKLIFTLQRMNYASFANKFCGYFLTNPPVNKPATEKEEPPCQPSI